MLPLAWIWPIVLWIVASTSRLWSWVKFIDITVLLYLITHRLDLTQTSSHLSIYQFHSQTLLKVTKEHWGGGWSGSRPVAQFRWLQVGCGHSMNTGQKVQLPRLDAPVADFCHTLLLDLGTCPFYFCSATASLSMSWASVSWNPCPNLLFPFEAKSRFMRKFALPPVPWHFRLPQVNGKQQTLGSLWSQLHVVRKSNLRKAAKWKTNLISQNGYCIIVIFIYSPFVSFFFLFLFPLSLILLFSPLN